MKSQQIEDKFNFSLKSSFSIGLAITAAIIMCSLMFSIKIFAAGGVGGGGSGSGGGGGGASYGTRNGHGWVVYDVNGWGPTGGFRNGTSWGSVQATCQNANATSVMVFGIANPGGDVRGYNFVQDYSIGRWNAGSIVDHGKATVIPTGWASSAFFNLPSHGVDITPFTFGGNGGNVSWFCAGLDPTRHDPAGDAVANCNAGFQGWALDADNLFAQLGIGIVIKRPNEAWNSSNFRLNGVADNPIPNPPFNTAALLAFGVGGNRGYTIPMPSQFTDNTTYDWMALAANAPNTQGNPLGISIIGQGTFTCPPPPTYYDLTPSVPIINNNTGVVQFSVDNSASGVSRQTGGVGVDIVRNIWINNNRAFSATASNTQIAGYGNWARTETVIVNSGDVICAQIDVGPSAGQTDGAYTRGWVSAGGLGVTCVTVVAKPYFRVYGSDVVVGKNFVDSSGVCPAGKNPNASINTFSMDRPGVGWVGSGAQFAVSATGTISSFISASMHNGVTSGTGVPFPANGIYFGNGSNPTPGGNDQNGYAGCLPDYERYVANNGGFPAPANRSISQSDISSSTATQIFVDGDITITGTGIRSDINDTTAFGSIADIKPVVVIARGNINIEPGVDNLYGLYVALPRADSTGGTINTCYTGGSPTIACNNTLTVNGSFVANKVELNRLAGDIRNATANEDDTSTNIAEKFIVTPEFYLSFTNVHNSSQDANSVGQYRSLDGLPPVL